MLSWGVDNHQNQGRHGTLVYTVLVILLIMTAVMGVFIKIIISDQVDMQIRLESLEKNVEILRKMVEQVQKLKQNTHHFYYWCHGFPLKPIKKWYEKILI